MSPLDFGGPFLDEKSGFSIATFPFFWIFAKNAAKRTRQHAGKKYREYAQRRVCFVNEEVP